MQNCRYKQSNRRASQHCHPAKGLRLHHIRAQHHAHSHRQKHRDLAQANVGERCRSSRVQHANQHAQDAQQPDHGSAMQRQHDAQQRGQAKAQQPAHEHGPWLEQSLLDRSAGAERCTGVDAVAVIEVVVEQVSAGLQQHSCQQRQQRPAQSKPAVQRGAANANHDRGGCRGERFWAHGSPPVGKPLGRDGARLGWRR